MEAVEATHKVWNRRISTGRLNRWLEGVLAHHPPPAVSGRRLKIRYMTQVKTRPPGFVLSCSLPQAMPQSYLRYLTNGIREAFDMPGVPIRMMPRGRTIPMRARPASASCSGK
jgi:GTPase